MQAEAFELVAFAAAALAFALVLTRGAASRRTVVSAGLVGPGGPAAVAAGPSFDPPVRGGRRLGGLLPVSEIYSYSKKIGTIVAAEA